MNNSAMDHIKAAWRAGGTLPQYEAAARAYGEELTAELQKELAKAREEKDDILRKVIGITGFIVVGPSDDLSEVGKLVNERDELRRRLQGVSRCCRR